MNYYPLILILIDLRSTWNVGAILRTADAAGINRVITCGYTPHPSGPQDPRPPHVIAANDRSIAKTALGAEKIIPIDHYDQVSDALQHLRHKHYSIAALEQAEDSVSLFSFTPSGPLALLLGNEVSGLDPDILKTCDHILELPMIGRKESLNVSVAAGIALYQLRFGHS